MNTWVSDFASNAMVQRIGWALLHFVWQGTALALLLAVGLQLMRKRSPQARWALACATLLLMVAAPIVTFIIIHPQPAPTPAPASGDARASKPLPPGISDWLSEKTADVGQKAYLGDYNEQPATQPLVLTRDDTARLSAHKAEAEAKLLGQLARGDLGAAVILTDLHCTRALPILRQQLLAERYFYGWEGPDYQHDAGAYLRDDQYPRSLPLIVAIERISGKPVAEAVALTDEERSALEAQAALARLPVNEEEGVAPTEPWAAKWLLGKLTVAVSAAKSPAPSSSAMTTPASGSWLTRSAAAAGPALPYLVGFWLMGMIVLSVWHVGGWAILQRTRRLDVRPPESAVADLFRQLLQRLRMSRPVKLLESARVAVPIVVGWLRPVILLPVSVLTGLTPNQLEAVLAHELAHVRRYDCLVRLFQAVVETLLFYHPAVWWVSSRIRQESEHCCDEEAVRVCGDRREYAMTLARVAELGRQSPHLAAAASGGKLLSRIRRIVGLPTTEGPRRATWFAGFLILAALLVAVPLACRPTAGPTLHALPPAPAPPATQPAAKPAPEASPATQGKVDPEIVRAMLNDADRIVKEQREEFSRPDGPDALLAYSAAVRFRDHPADALAAGRAIKEPFYASLAIGAMAARQMADAPDNAAKLLLEAQGRAMAINHWSGSDATSMGYLFQVVPLFEQPLAERVLDASHANLRKWATDGQTSQHPMLMLSRATVAVKPGGVASLLDEITANRSFRSHHYDSVGLLSEVRFQNEKEWAAGQVDAFYESGQAWPWPACETTLGGLLLADALHDLPRALKRIATLPEGQQDIGRCAVMNALREHGRAKEAQGVLELIEARAKVGAKQPDWIVRMLPDVRPRWAAEDKAPPSVRPADIDRFLADPQPDSLRQIADTPGGTHFRDARQASAFLAAGLPLVRAWPNQLPGGDHLYSPRRMMLGQLARIAALLGRAEEARKLAAEIDVPELRAFCLLQTAEALHPLPDVVRKWPLYFYWRTEITIAQPPAEPAGNGSPAAQGADANRLGNGQATSPPEWMAADRIAEVNSKLVLYRGQKAYPLQQQFLTVQRDGQRCYAFLDEATHDWARVTFPDLICVTCDAAGKISRIYRVDDFGISLATGLEADSLTWLGPDRVFVELHVNPDLAIGVTLWLATGVHVSVRECQVSWSPDKTRLVWIESPPHGAPPEVPAIVRTSTNAVCEIPRNGVDDVTPHPELTWAADGKTVIVKLNGKTLARSLVTPLYPYPDQSDGYHKIENAPLNVPPEFRDGAATEEQARAWANSVIGGSGPMEVREAELVPGGRKALFIADQSYAGTGGNQYLVFAREPKGLAYVGDIHNVGRAVPPDSQNRPRRVTFVRSGGGQGDAYLLVLTDKGFVEQANIPASGGDGAAADLKRTYETLFGQHPITQATLDQVFGEAARPDAKPALAATQAEDDATKLFGRVYAEVAEGDATLTKLSAAELADEVFRRENRDEVIPAFIMFYRRTADQPAARKALADRIIKTTFASVGTTQPDKLPYAQSPRRYLHDLPYIQMLDVLAAREQLLELLGPNAGYKSIWDLGCCVGPALMKALGRRALPQDSPRMVREFRNKYEGSQHLQAIHAALEQVTGRRLPQPVDGRGVPLTGDEGSGAYEALWARQLSVPPGGPTTRAEDESNDSDGRGASVAVPGGVLRVFRHETKRNENGKTVIESGWRCAFLPAGGDRERVIDGDLPAMSSRIKLSVSPDSKYLAVLSDCEGVDSLDVIDLSLLLSKGRFKSLVSAGSWPASITLKKWDGPVLLIESEQLLTHENPDDHPAFMFSEPQTFAVDAQAGKLKPISDGAKDPVAFFTRQLRAKDSADGEKHYNAVLALGQLKAASALPDLRKALAAATQPDRKESLQNAIDQITRKPAATPAAPTTQGDAVDRVRRAVWPEAEKLLNAIKAAGTAQERDQLVAAARAKLPQWYRGMDVAPPDTNEPKWLMLVPYDLTPEEQFAAGREKILKLAADFGKTVPANASRRQLFTILTELISGSPAASTTQPAATPAPPTTQASTAPEAAWSKEVNGLRGRVVMVRKQVLCGTTIIQANLELRNTSDGPISLAWSTQRMKFKVLDAGGKDAPRPTAMEWSGPAWRKEDVVIPAGGAVSVGMSVSGMGIRPDIAGVLVLSPNDCWVFKSADPDWFLHAAMEVPEDAAADAGKGVPWHGRMELLPAMVPLKPEPLDREKAGALIARLGAKMIEVPHSTASEEAAASLSLIDDERAIPWYVKAMGTDDSQLRQRALDRLSRLNGDAALEGIKKGMHTQGADIGNCTTPLVASQAADAVRHATAIALARSSHPKAKELLLTMRGDSYAAVRIVVVQTFGEVKTEQAAELLNEMTRDGDEGVRSEAKRYLELRKSKASTQPAAKPAPAAPADSGQIDPAKVRAKIAALAVQDDTLPYEEQPTDWLRTRREKIVPQLAEGIADKNPKVASACIYILSERPPDDRVKEALITVAGDVSNPTSPLATLSLRPYGADPRARKLLEAASKDEKRFPQEWDRGRLAAAAGDRASAVKLLAGLLYDDSGSHSREAVKELRAVGPEATPALERASKQAAWEIAARAYLALAELDPKGHALTADQKQFLEKSSWRFKESTESANGRMTELAKLIREQIRPYVMQMLSGDSLVRGEALTILVAWKDKEALPQIRKILTEQNHPWREAVAAYLVIDGGKESDDAVVGLVKGSNGFDHELIAGGIVTADIPVERKILLLKRVGESAAKADVLGGRYVVPQAVRWTQGDISLLLAPLMDSETDLGALGLFAETAGLDRNKRFAPQVKRAVELLAEAESGMNSRANDNGVAAQRIMNAAAACEVKGIEAQVKTMMASSNSAVRLAAAAAAARLRVATSQPGGVIATIDQQLSNPKRYERKQAAESLLMFAPTNPAERTQWEDMLLAHLGKPSEDYALRLLARCGGAKTVKALRPILDGDDVARAIYAAWVLAQLPDKPVAQEATRRLAVYAMFQHQMYQQGEGIDFSVAPDLAFHQTTGWLNPHGPELSDPKQPVRLLADLLRPFNLNDAEQKFSVRVAHYVCDWQGIGPYAFAMRYRPDAGMDASYVPMLKLLAKRQPELEPLHVKGQVVPHFIGRQQAAVAIARITSQPADYTGLAGESLDSAANPPGPYKDQDQMLARFVLAQFDKMGIKPGRPESDAEWQPRNTFTTLVRRMCEDYQFGKGWLPPFWAEVQNRGPATAKLMSDMQIPTGK